MKQLKKRLLLVLPVFAGILITCMSCSSGPKGIDDDMNTLTVPPATKTARETYQGKINVAHITPKPKYEWAVLTYSLKDYAGKEITVTLSMEVWLTVSTKVAWQAQLDGSYPIIAGSFSSEQTAGQWVPITGSARISIPDVGGTLFLSSQQLGAGNEIYIANFSMTVVDESGGAGEEESEGAAGEKTLKMTIGAKENLTGRITAFDTAGRTLSWQSSNPDVASVDRNGTVTAVNFTEGGTASSAATGTATIPVTGGGDTDTFTIPATTEGQVDTLSLPPLKDRFANYFMIGNIVRGGGDISGGGTISETLKRHFNVLTAENIMKASYYGGSRSRYIVANLTFSASDTFVNAAAESGFKVHGHVLLWHHQNPAWIRAIADETDKTVALEAMRDYITQVVGRYRGKIHSWDVLNEIFPDGVRASHDWKTSMRGAGSTNYDNQGANPWFLALGPDFVYEGFKAARLADPVAILYYNDYNLNEAGKSTVVANMVRAVNDAWKTDPRYDGRLLIEGIGMQSHHNTGVSAAAIKASLDRFRPLGVKISISELDVLSAAYNPNLEGANRAAHPSLSAAGKMNAANLYGQYFKLFIENADIIERVTFWGLFDYASWRSGGLPLPFEGSPSNTASPGSIRAKPAYYKIIGVL
jgi:GH35 family endo-1,4-beta-xylanase